MTFDTTRFVWSRVGRCMLVWVRLVAVSQAVLLLLFCGSSVADAHQGGIERTVMFEPTVEGLQVLVHLQVTDKQRARSLSLFADQNRDGDLDEAEHNRLKHSLSERALGGLRWRLDKKLMRPGKTEALLKRSAAGLELLVSFVIKLSPASHTLELARRGGDPGHMRLVAAPGRTLKLAKTPERAPYFSLTRRETLLISEVVAPVTGR